MAKQARNGRFAGRSGHGNHLFASAQFRQHFGAVQEGNAQFACADEVGVIGFNGSAVDDEVGLFGNAGAVLRNNGNSLFFQTLENLKVGCTIRAGDAVSAVRRQLRDAVHAASADSDKVTIHRQRG